MKGYYKFVNSQNKELEVLAGTAAIAGFCKEKGVTLNELNKLFSSETDPIVMFESVSLLIWYCAENWANYQETEFKKTKKHVVAYLDTCQDKLPEFIQVFTGSIDAGVPQTSGNVEGK